MLAQTNPPAPQVETDTNIPKIVDWLTLNRLTLNAKTSSSALFMLMY